MSRPGIRRRVEYAHVTISSMGGWVRWGLHGKVKHAWWDTSCQRMPRVRDMGVMLSLHTSGCGAEREGESAHARSSPPDAIETFGQADGHCLEPIKSYPDGWECGCQIEAVFCHEFRRVYCTENTPAISRRLRMHDEHFPMHRHAWDTMAPVLRPCHTDSPFPLAGSTSRNGIFLLLLSVA